uniref:Zgc:123010 n=1 Tax=Latimeria chalumnae TaxID=7897 RepID=H3AKP6_LATCH
RQRERRKLEKVKDSEGNEQYLRADHKEEDEDDSDSEEELEEVPQLHDSLRIERKHSEPYSDSENRPRSGTAPIPALDEVREKRHRSYWRANQSKEPEWDVNSAFVANAASHIKPKTRTKSNRKSKENKENEAKTQEVNGTDPALHRCRQLAEKGIELVKKGNFSEAADQFTEAIKLNPKDHRFFGNRSYCYDQVGQYSLALEDADTSIRLAADWPKGYFRKGRALLGLKKFSDAESAFEAVLKFDQACEEAENELITCRVLQLMESGFSRQQSVSLLREYKSVSAVLAASLTLKVCLYCRLSPCCSLWVGNVTIHVKEKHLWDLFKTYGEIDSIRVLHERFCAFVNFKCPDATARALDGLQGREVENTRLVVRYPDRRFNKLAVSAQKPAAVATPGSKRRGPVNGDECYFWRTTGCYFGEKCRFKHIPAHRGLDKRQWQS